MLKTSPKASILIIAALLALCFIPFDLEADEVFFGPLFDAGHYAVFLLVAAALQQTGIFPGRSAAVKQLAALLCVCAAILTIELLQPLFGRTASLVDIRNGILGSLAGALLRAAQSRGRSQFICALFTAAILQVVLLSPAIAGFKAMRWRANAWPLLADFETPAEALLWAPVHFGGGFTEIRFNPRGAAHGRYGLEITGGGGAWRGAEYDAGERDWSKYRELVFHVYNPLSEPLALRMRIDDSRKSPSYAERFNKSITLAPQWNEIRIPTAEIASGPRDGRLDLTQIKKVLIILASRPEQLTIFIDQIELV